MKQTWLTLGEQLVSRAAHALEHHPRQVTAVVAAVLLPLGLMGFGQSFSQWRPDILVVLGDRYEMLAAALAALPYKIPVAHLAGGELTEGAIDDALRHCISKLSHLHFTATREYADRVIQLGEEPSRVFVSGALALDGAWLSG